MKIFSSAQNYIKKNITSPAIQRIIFFDMLLLGLLFLPPYAQLQKAHFFSGFF